jgi:hypothetical protein
MAPAKAPEALGGQKVRAAECYISWSDPGWREAARDYHTARAGRRLVAQVERNRLVLLSLLLADDISVARAWCELNDPGARATPQTTVDALLCQLRTDGLAAFEDPSCRRRLADLSEGQLREVMAALIRTRTSCAAVTDELLIALDGIRR